MDVLLGLIDLGGALAGMVEGAEGGVVAGARTGAAGGGPETTAGCWAQI